MGDRRLEIVQLQETLKELMSARKHRLTNLADHLGISIATAKRLLNGDDLSMERVLEICDWLDVSFHEVVEIAKRRRAEYHYCSEEQEEYLASHQPQFAFLRALHRGDSPESIQKKFGLSASDIDAYTADLEAQQFLRLLPDGKIQLIVKDGMDWRPNGALWRAYYHRWTLEVYDHMQTMPTDAPDLIVDISQRKFTASSIQALRKEMDDLSRKYASISRLERQVYPPEKLHYYTLSILGDQWTAPLFDIPKYERRNE